MDRRFAWALPFALALAAGSAIPADARPARCFTTDDGHYACDFAARGKPTYFLNMLEPDAAAGALTLGGRNVNLPGRFLRDRQDRACWNNNATGAKVCVW
jgi:hypothetical protein